MVPRLVNETDKEFTELFGEPVAIQEDTNLANDEEANERIQIVEYKPDETKYARIFDIGNGEWNFYDLVDKKNVIIFQEKVAERAKTQEEWNERMMRNIITSPKKLALNLYGPNFVIVKTWKDAQGQTQNTVVSGIFTHIQNCRKECEKRNNFPQRNGTFSVMDITCNVRKI